MHDVAEGDRPVAGARARSEETKAALAAIGLSAAALTPAIFDSGAVGQAVGGRLQLHSVLYCRQSAAGEYSG